MLYDAPKQLLPGMEIKMPKLRFYDGHGVGGLDPNDDHGNFPGIDLDRLQLGHSTQRFIKLVDAILVHPDNGVIAAGRNAATDANANIFWLYTPDSGLRVKAEA